MTYEDAIILAVRAHADQTRWNEDPYIVHPLRVALRVSAAMTNRDRFTEKDIRLAKTVAVLHDVLEDSPTTFRQLKDMFGPDIVRAVELVSRSDDMTYFQFIEQLRHSGDHIAILVKLADLDDNLSDLPEERASLRKRYEQAKAALTNALEEILRD